MAHDDDFLGCVLGAAVVFIAVLLVMGDPSPHVAASHADVIVTGSATGPR